MNNVYFGLREMQKHTFDACIENKFGIISDTCGSGKSNIEFELICDAILDNKKFIVLAAHRLDLIDQHISNFNEYVNTYHPELINKFTMFEISSANRSEKGIVNTTKISEIKNTIIGTTIPTIITICYHSIERLYQSFYGSKYRVDLMICDEGHYGMSCERGKSEKMNIKIDKYACAQFCNSFLVFTATPFKKTMIIEKYGIKFNIIHDYSYAEAEKDGIVLPFKANFYVGEYSEKSRIGMIETAYSDLKKVFYKTSAKLLVCGTGLEENQKFFTSIIKKYKKQIDEGSLAICKVGSTSITEDNEKIPSCEFVNKFMLDRNESLGLSEYKFNFKDDRLNKLEVFKAMHEWLKDIHHNIIIIHCQMLGVGVDIPNINGVCILGNKESADLYQSMMRPCRIAHFDRNVDRKDRLEDHFEVYVHSDEDSQKSIENFCEQLKEIGGISLLEALTLGSISGSHEKEKQKTAASQDILMKTVKSAKVFEDCQVIYNSKEFVGGLRKFMVLIEKYPEHREYIEAMNDKFLSKNTH